MRTGARRQPAGANADEGTPLFPHAHATGFGLAHAPGTLIGGCGRSPGIACRIVWDTSHNLTTAKLTASYLGGAVDVVLRLIFLAVVALAIRALAHRLIDRATARAADLTIHERLRRTAPRGTAGWVWRRFRPGPLARISHGAGHGSPSGGAGHADGKALAGLPASAPSVTVPGMNGSPELSHERRRQRAHALGSILRSVASVTIFGIAVVTALGDLGVNLAPVLASAGVVGVAVGFGAQNLVKDFISGIFMLLEDQYGVGDVVNVNGATGTVEAVSLRVTRLRDVNGVVWHVRNGTIEKVGNESQGWARAVIDLPVPYERDIASTRQVMEQVAAGIWQEPPWRALMLEKPDVWGVQDLSGTEVLMRIVAKTPPLRQWEVARELRQRLKSALDAAAAVAD